MEKEGNVITSTKKDKTMGERNDLRLRHRRHHRRRGSISFLCHRRLLLCLRLYREF